MPPSAITGTSASARGAHRIHDRGELRHADAGDDPRGADRARTDADLHRVGAGVDQRLGAVGGGDVAGDDLRRGWSALLDPLDRLEHVARNGRGRCRSPPRRRPHRSAPSSAR